MAGSLEIPILGYGDVDLQVTRPSGGGILRLKDVAFCTDFNTNLVSFQMLRQRGFHWNTRTNCIVREDDSVLCQMQEVNGQQVIEHRTPDSIPYGVAFAVNHLVRRRATSRDPRPAAIGDGYLWHRRMGHPGPMSLYHLGQTLLGVRLRGPTTVQCDHCAQAKITR